MYKLENIGFLYDPVCKCNPLYFLSILLRLLNPLNMMRKMINPTKYGRRNTRKRRRRIRREVPAPTQMMNGKRKLRTT